MPATKTDKHRLSVAKTYKLYINGKFPRTESGRYFKVNGRRGVVLANACLASRKDMREAVVAARAASASWRGVSAYLRGQIIYRIAELLEGRAAQFAELRHALGDTPRQAERMVSASIDTLVYYAGWCDKLTQVFGAINPVATSHYNFSTLEPTGVVGVIAPVDGGLGGLVRTVAPAIAAGNTTVVVADPSDPLTAISLAEVMHASDVPAGVVNVLTGAHADVVPHMARHKDINSIVHALAPGEERANLEREAAINIKRVASIDADAKNLSPYRMLDTTETKTTWHPIGV